MAALRKPFLPAAPVASDQQLQLLIPPAHNVLSVMPHAKLDHCLVQQTIWKFKGPSVNPVQLMSCFGALC